MTTTETTNTSSKAGDEELTITNSLVYSILASVAIGFMLSIFTLLTIAFNLGSVFIFVTDKELKTFSDRLFLNLALADAMIGLAVMSVNMILTLTGGVWVWSHASCIAFTTLNVTFNYVSVINTLVVSLDHYLGVLRRERYEAKQDLRLLLIMTITPWVSIFVLFGMPIFLWEHIVSEVQEYVPGVCQVPFKGDKIVYLVLVISPFVPITAVPIIDFFIYFTIRNQFFKKVVKHLESISQEVINLDFVGTEVPVKQVFEDKTYLKLYTKTLLSSLSEGSGVVDWKCEETPLEDAVSDSSDQLDKPYAQNRTAEDSGNENTTKIHSAEFKKIKPTSIVGTTGVHQRITPRKSSSVDSKHTANFPATLHTAERSAPGRKTSEKHPQGKTFKERNPELSASSSKNNVGMNFRPWKPESARGIQGARRTASGKTPRQGNEQAEEIEQSVSSYSDDSEEVECPSSSDKDVGTALEQNNSSSSEEQKLCKEEAMLALKEYAVDLQEARLSFVLGMGLVVTCTPFESLFLVGTLCGVFPDSACLFHVPKKVLRGCQWFVLLNSTVTPVLIFSIDHRYRAAFFRFLSWAKFWNGTS